MSVIRVGSNKKFAENWDNIFGKTPTKGKKSAGTSKKTAKKSAKPAAAATAKKATKKTAKKKAAKKR